MANPSIPPLDIVVVGAGPAGLACAIEAAKAGLSHVILDQGTVADAIRRFPTNLTFFSTPELLEIGNVPFLSSGFRPTRTEVVQYYQRVAKEHALHVLPSSRVSAIEKNGREFHITSGEKTHRSPCIIMATGYFDGPNPYNVPGAELPKVMRYYNEPYRYFGQKVAVVGGKNSAVEVALDLFRHGADVTLIHRGETFSEGVKYWILPDIENRIKSGEIRTLFGTTISEIREGSILVEGAVNEELENDFVFVMIGYRPDIWILKNAGVDLDPDSLGPVHNPETMETNVRGLYVAGSLAAGKYNNKIFIENGRLHGQRIISAIQQK